MKTIAFIGAVLALILPASAWASDNSKFLLTVSSEHYNAGKTYTSKPDQMLAEVRISPTSAIQLDGDVPPELTDVIGIDKKSPLITGSVLYSAGNDRSMYCGKAWTTLLHGPRWAPCLIDSDHDGKFDHSVMTAQVLVKPGALVIDKQIFAGHFMYPEFTLQAPIPYHPLGKAAVPQIGGQIAWRSDYNKKKPGPIHYLFGFLTYSATAGSLFSESVDVTFDGAPVSVDLYGITITVVGVGKRGAPICQFQGSVDDVTIPFTIQNVTYHVFYY